MENNEVNTLNGQIPNNNSSTTNNQEPKQESIQRKIPKHTILVITISAAFIFLIGILTYMFIPIHAKLNSEKRNQHISFQSSVKPPIQTPTHYPVDTRINGLPKIIPAGSPPILFTGTLTNHNTIILYNVAPLFHIIGGPCNCVMARLERYNQIQRKWHQEFMPEGDGDPYFTKHASGGVTLHHNQSVSINYRLTVDSHNLSKPVNAELYAVQLPSGDTLGFTSLSLHLVTSNSGLKQNP